MLLKKIEHDNSLHFHRLSLVIIISTAPYDDDGNI